jgi:predicted DNA binding CopG/RHH family protein
MNIKSKAKPVTKNAVTRNNPAIKAIQNAEDAWESRELGADEEFVRVASDELEARVQASLGMQMISIRLPKELIDSLKMIGQYRGIGYQPLVRDLLGRFAASELKIMAQELYESEQARLAVRKALKRDCA